MTEEEKKERLLRLAKKIKELKKERNLTQADCLNDTGIHFARIEQGTRDISFTTIIQIVKYFKITPDNLF